MFQIVQYVVEPNLKIVGILEGEASAFGGDLNHGILIVLQHARVKLTKNAGCVAGITGRVYGPTGINCIQSNVLSVQTPDAFFYSASSFVIKGSNAVGKLNRPRRTYRRTPQIDPRYRNIVFPDRHEHHPKCTKAQHARGRFAC